jgi:predicted DNA-binding transcriptional regulator AlpA
VRFPTILAGASTNPVSRSAATRSVVACLGRPEEDPQRSQTALDHFASSERTRSATCSGVSRQWVYQLAKRSDFPKPIAELAQGKVWVLADTEAWIGGYRAGMGADRADRRDSGG